MRAHRLTLCLVTALVAPSGLAAQAPARQVPVPTMSPRAEDVATLAGVIKAYYDVITGPAGQPRQWSRDRSLYIPDLRFVATGFAKGRPYARVMTHQDFVDASDSEMATTASSSGRSTAGRRPTATSAK